MRKGQRESERGAMGEGTGKLSVQDFVMVSMRLHLRRVDKTTRNEGDRCGGWGQTTGKKQHTKNSFHLRLKAPRRQDSSQ